MPTAAKVKNLKEPGKYADRDGLYLNITTRGNKSWVYRYQLNGKRREMGLGSFKNQTLADARDLAYQARQLHKKGIDPKEQRDQDKAHSSTMTFEECAKAYIKSHEAGWKNEKHISQWKSTLKQYAYPTIGNLPVNKVDTARVMKILQPIWKTKTETASRLRGRIENILSWAIVQGHHEEALFNIHAL